MTGTGARPVQESAMRYLVDGYNYAHQAGLMAGDLEASRRRVAARVGALAGGRGRVTIVWDAAKAPPAAPRRSSSAGVEHVFAGSPGSADREITELVRRDDDPRSLCVVSDDLEVTSAARQLGAGSLSVEEAEARIESKTRSPRGRGGSGGDDGEKPRPPTGRELDEWERLFEEGEGEGRGREDNR